MKKLIVNSLILLCMNAYLLPAVHADDSTPSAEIRVKLEQLKKDIASKAAKLKLEVNNKLKDKAYIGKVKLKSATTITLATKNGPKIVNINQDTAFVSNIKGKKYSQKLISEEDYIAALGDVDEIGVLTAKNVTLLPAITSEPKDYLWGQIISVSDKLFTLKDKSLKNVAVSAQDPSSVKVGDFVILTGNLGKNEIFSSDFIYIIPQGGILKPVRPTGGPKKVSTPSASLKPTKPSPKPTSR